MAQYRVKVTPDGSGYDLAITGPEDFAGALQAPAMKEVMDLAKGYIHQRTSTPLTSIGVTITMNFQGATTP